MTENASPQLTCDAFAATQVVLREREARDRGWWGEMADCFGHDSRVEISWFQGSGGDFAAASKAMGRTTPSRHRLGPPTVRVAAERGVVFLPAVVETYPLVDDIDLVLEAYCRLLFRVRKAEDAWRISRMDVIYERDELRATTPGQALSISPEELQGLRRPYRFLAWMMGRAGFTVSQDLPGDDRPDLVASVYDAAFDWAEIARPPITLTV